MIMFNEELHRVVSNQNLNLKNHINDVIVSNNAHESSLNLKYTLRYTVILQVKKHSTGL